MENLSLSENEVLLSLMFFINAMLSVCNKQQGDCITSYLFSYDIE